MNRLAYRVATSVATAALVLSSFAPIVAADTTVEISGNGSDSYNKADVDISTSTVVTQNNNANIQNNVSISANSGDNKANDNTGGDVSIDTGDASANVSVNNAANSNTAQVNGCCLGDITAKISENGSDSTNKLYLDAAASTYVTQNNNAYVYNNVDVDLDTGNNKANDNTGGNVSIDTGNAKADGVTISNAVNRNVAQVGGGNGGSVWVEISGNGSDSYNKADVDLTHQNVITQNNNANIENDVYVWANSGHNKANDNTGGDVTIDTGNADVDVDIDNMANFNAADVDNCGCLVDLTVKIKENGSDSRNKANVTLASALFVDQNNNFSCGGEYEEWDEKDGDACANVEVESDTGYNKANDNTDSDEPSIDTGNAGADVSVNNVANSNVLGDVDLGDIEIPNFDLPGDLSGLLVLLLGLFS
jgi:hypothetical protein